MAKYEVEVEGKTFRFDWNKPEPPTEDDVLKMMMPSRIEAIGRGAAQGATLGFGEEASAGLEALTGISKLTQPSAKQAKWLKVQPEKKSILETYRQIRDEERAKNLTARQAHPWAYGISELAGVAPLAAIPGLQGIPATTGMGAVGGLGMSEADLTKGEIGKAAISTGIGGGLGLAAGIAMPSLGKAAKGVYGTGKGLLFPKKSTIDKIITAASKDVKGIPSVTQFEPKQMGTIGFKPEGTVSMGKIGFGKPTEETRGISKLVVGKVGGKEKMLSVEAPANLIKQSIDTKTPLFDLAGPEIHEMAQTAKLASPEARKILVGHAEELLEKQPTGITNIVNKVLGSKSKLQNLDDILQKYEDVAKPLYEEAFQAGDLAVTNPEIATGVTDPYLQRYIKAARNSPMGRTLKDLPDTNIRVLDAAKRKMDDAIEVAKRIGENEDARSLTVFKKELTDKLDEIVPNYKAARGAASERFKLEEAQNTAAKIIKAETPEEISRMMPKLSPAEKEAFVVGLRDQIMSEIGRSSKTGRSNIAEKIFGSSENYIVRKNLRAALGVKDYNILMSEINPIVRAGVNASKLLGGSQTAEKEALKVSFSSRSVKSIFIKNITDTIKQQTGMKSEDVARMMIDPEYLAKIMGKRGK